VASRDDTLIFSAGVRRITACWRVDSVVRNLDFEDARAGILIVDVRSDNSLSQFEIQFAAYGHVHYLVYGHARPREDDTFIVAWPVWPA